MLRVFLVAIVVTFIILFLGKAEENATGDGPVPETFLSGHALSFLEDFQVVSGTVTFIDANHIVVAFENSNDGVNAVVVFVADCNDEELCVIEDLAAYMFGAAPALQPAG